MSRSLLSGLQQVKLHTMALAKIQRMRFHTVGVLLIRCSQCICLGSGVRPLYTRKHVLKVRWEAVATGQYLTSEESDCGYDSFDMPRTQNQHKQPTLRAPSGMKRFSKNMLRVSTQLRGRKKEETSTPTWILVGSGNPSQSSTSIRLYHPQVCGMSIIHQAVQPWEIMKNPGHGISLGPNRYSPNWSLSRPGWGCCPMSPSLLQQWLVTRLKSSNGKLILIQQCLVINNGE